ncbi:MAG: EF-hand domain-containing protein [Pseudorhodobacter sp.]|nr:EF-hand domain-containing protein [Pseudorhodobacter sp.]
MIDKNKIVGGTLVALAIALTAGVALADRGDRMGGMGGMGGPMGGAGFEMDFAAIDADKDGKITQAEIDAFRAARTAAIDTDGDGKLSAAEMTTRPMPARMFERLDTDKDGAISEAEITAAKERMTERRGGMRGKDRGHHGPRGNN